MDLKHLLLPVLRGGYKAKRFECSVRRLDRACTCTSYTRGYWTVSHCEEWNDCSGGYALLRCPLIPSLRPVCIYKLCDRDAVVRLDGEIASV